MLLPRWRIQGPASGQLFGLVRRAVLWFGASIHRADGPEQRFASAVIVGDQSAVARRVYCKDFDIPGGAAAIDVYLGGQIAYRLLQPHRQHATKLCRDQTGQCDTGQFLDRAIAADLVVALGRLQIITVCVISDRPIEVPAGTRGAGSASTLGRSGHRPTSPRRVEASSCRFACQACSPVILARC